MKTAFRGIVTMVLLAWTLAVAAQTPYQPKFRGDPARSESEAIALGYVRVIIRAENAYQRKNGKYASSLIQLVHSGSVTRRMTQTDRGDYTVAFRARKDGYELTMMPKHPDSQHRSFYTNEDGVIRGDEEKTANEDSPPVK